MTETTLGGETTSGTAQLQTGICPKCNLWWSGSHECPGAAPQTVWVNPYGQVLDRIAAALERIVAALEEGE